MDTDVPTVLPVLCPDTDETLLLPMVTGVEVVLLEALADAC